MSKKKAAAKKGKSRATVARGKTKGVKPTRATKPRPRQQPLEGMEDPRIAELEEVGTRYAEIRDARIELNREEGSLKDLARSLMHKHKKSVYHRPGVCTITLIPGEEDVKVNVPKVKDDKEGE